ncbi:uncharacterized protein LOC121020174 isoform X32 [Herpailurus yagouaroundi]|uniref:uncharacterized protein LOC121020174 isoform X32 n=1 Tax=Herpailurus yagouaroundi TaxID=1608482 RepID=UPI001AD73FAA|nr:uncharacterized protein LOC121020174 isoform X32 [Puma yagouaroundi]
MENRWEWSENRWERGGQVAVWSKNRWEWSENRWEHGEQVGMVREQWERGRQVAVVRAGGSVEDRWQWSENRWERGGQVGVVREQVAVVREQWERGGQVAVVEEQVGSAAASQGRLAAPTRPEPCAESPLSTLLDPGSPAHLAGFMRAKVPVLRAHP